MSIRDLSADDLHTLSLALMSAINHELKTEAEHWDASEFDFRVQCRQRKDKFQKQYDAIMDEVARRLGVVL